MNRLIDCPTCGAPVRQSDISTASASHAGDDVAVLPVSEVSELELWIEENAETPPLSLNDWYVPVTGLKQFMDRQQRSAPVSEAVSGAVSETSSPEEVIAVACGIIASFFDTANPECAKNALLARTINALKRLIPADSEPVAEIATTAEQVEDDAGESAEFEIWQDDMVVAGSSGPRDGALAEAMNYARQYAQDGPVTMYEVTRKEISNNRPIDAGD